MAAAFARMQSDHALSGPAIPGSSSVVENLVGASGN